MGTTATSVDHVGVVVVNADEAASRFVVLLGLIVDHEEFVDSVGARLVYLTASSSSPTPTFGTAIQLLEPHRAGPLADYLAKRGEGLHHLCFSVADVTSSLREIGQSTDGIFVGGRGRRCAFLEERPGGALVELIEKD